MFTDSGSIVSLESGFDVAGSTVVEPGAASQSDLMGGVLVAMAAVSLG